MLIKAKKVIKVRVGVTRSQHVRVTVIVLARDAIAAASLLLLLLLRAYILSRRANGAEVMRCLHGVTTQTGEKLIKTAELYSRIQQT